MHNIIKRLKDIEHMADQVGFSVTEVNGHLVIGDIRLTIYNDIDNFRYTEYRILEDTADSIARETQSGCNITLEFYGEDEDFDMIYIEAGSATTKLKRIPISAEDLDDLSEDLDNLYIDFLIDDRGATISEMVVSDRLRQNKNVVKSINNITRVAINKEDCLIMDTPSTAASSDIINSLANDLSILYSIDYFEPFFSRNHLLKEKSVSIYYYNNTVIKSRNKNIINVFHQGYNFGWNEYNHDNKDIEGLHFTTIHSFEDLSWTNSTCSKYWDGPVDGNSLNGRANRFVKETDNLGFNILFSKYFSTPVIDILLRDVEFEIMLDKGEAVTVYKSNDSLNCVVGFNKDGDRVFSLSCESYHPLVGNQDLPLDDLVAGANSLITDINTAVEKLVEGKERTENNISWDL